MDGQLNQACISLLNVEAVCQNPEDHNIATSPAKLLFTCGEI